MRVLFLAALAALTLWQSAPALAAHMPPRQCVITASGNQEEASCPLLSPFEAITTTDYDAVRSNIGQAAAPIDAWNRCRYVDNTSTSTSVFVPFKSEVEWASFIRNHPAYLNLVTCARPTTMNITPNSACPSPSPAFEPVGLPYARTGTVIPKSATFTCAAEGACPGWTQTVHVNFTALNSDIKNPSWSSGAPTYLGDPPGQDSCPTAAADGVCGPANGVATSIMPATGLCSVGEPGPVGNNPEEDGHFWHWRCTGSGGGTTAVCSAPEVMAAACGDWTPRENDRLWSAVASTPDGAKLFATSVHQIYASADSGVTWTPLPNPDTVTFDPGIHWHRIATSADGTKVVALLSAGQFYTSTNSGLSWTAQESVWNWGGATMSADGTKIAVIAPLILHLHQRRHELDILRRRPTHLYIHRWLHRWHEARCSYS